MCETIWLDWYTARAGNRTESLRSKFEDKDCEVVSSPQRTVPCDPGKLTAFQRCQNIICFEHLSAGCMSMPHASNQSYMASSESHISKEKLAPLSRLSVLRRYTTDQF